MRSKLWCAFAVSAGTLIGVPAASAAPPTNDAFAAAAPLVTSTDSVRATIDEATVEAGEPDHGRQSVWYVFRPTESRRVVVELMNGQNLSPVTSVYTGASVSALQRVGQARNFRARVPFEAVAGQTYFIAVATQAPPSPPNSRFQLRLRNMPLPANDAFADAKPISIPGKYRGNAADATAELGEDESHSHSLWYRFRPRRTVNLTIDWIRGYCSGGAKLYTGSRLTSLRKVGDGPPIRLKALRGRLYHLAVDCYVPSLGDFILTLSDGSIKGKGVKLAVDDGQTVDSVRARGLRMTVTAERRVGVGIELKVSRATADRLGLKSRVLGTAQGPVNYNRSLPVDLRLTRAARRALADTEHLKATVRLEILRSDAPNRVLTVPVSL